VHTLFNEKYIGSHVRTYSWSWVIPLTDMNPIVSPKIWHHICCDVRYHDLGIGIWWKTKNGGTLLSTDLLIKVGLKNHNMYKMTPMIRLNYMLKAPTLLEHAQLSPKPGRAYVITIQEKEPPR
jgi:hypothetical protein